MRLRTVLRIAIYVLLGIILLQLLSWRISVMTTRFLDVDEFSYLHWVANFVKGERPYIDFFMFFPPVFLWVFAPVLFLFRQGSEVFLAARVVNFSFFLGMLGLISVLFGLMRAWRWALLPAIILAFLPMPYDKFLEVRPDNLATVVALGGLVGLVAALQRVGIHRRVSLWMICGALYSLSMLIFPKTVPFVIAAGVVLLIRLLFERSRQVIDELRQFCIGFVTPFGVVALYLLLLGDVSRVWYSLVFLPFEANLGGNFGVMEPHLFFFPNIAFYGGLGITSGLLINHALWFFGSIGMVVRLFSPWSTSLGERSRVYSELLIAGTGISLIVLYVMFYPLKHSQYLIPIALFIAWYASDVIAVFFDWLMLRTHIVFVLICVGLLGWGLGSVTESVNRDKLAQPMFAQLSEYEALRTTISGTDLVLDLEGRMLWWKDAYDICCVPFGAFTQYLTQPPAPLLEVLEAKQVPYIYQAETGRIGVLSQADQVYIRAHYVPFGAWGERLWKRK